MQCFMESERWRKTPEEGKSVRIRGDESRMYNTETGERERDASKVMNMIQTCMMFASTPPLPTDWQMGHSCNDKMFLTFSNGSVPVFHWAGDFSGRQRAGRTLGPLQRGRGGRQRAGWQLFKSVLSPNIVCNLHSTLNKTPRSSPFCRPKQIYMSKNRQKGDIVWLVSSSEHP